MKSLKKLERESKLMKNIKAWLILFFFYVRYYIYAIYFLVAGSFLEILNKIEIIIIGSKQIILRLII